MRIWTLVLLMLIAVTGWLVAEDKTNPSSQEEEKGKWYHKPIEDLDGDAFSKNRSFRGANWRGRDTEDWDKDIRPGVGESRDGRNDNNCNGISGWSGSKGKSNEEWLCGGSQSRGVVIFGDSAAAGFHIPAEWVEFTGLTENLGKLLDFDWIRENALKTRDGVRSNDSFLNGLAAHHNQKERGDDFWSILLHEFDWPHKTWATGFSDDINGESVYSQMRARNNCNHRDYQNVAVNGADSQDLADQVAVFSRTTSDKPVLGFVAYIGNDICSKTLESMTTPEKYRSGILEGLADLDKKVAPGSKIVLLGLVDGRILWNTMHDQTHPLGVTYAGLYQFLTDIKKNPCNTWLTSNEETRNLASARARELSNVLKEIAETRKYQNFEMIYMDLPMEKVLKSWKAKGNKLSDLIETVDGFHPSHTCHRELFKTVWEKLENSHPSFIGPVNSHNETIVEMFQDQGGH